VRDLELQVLVPQERLRAHGLTLEGVAETIRRTALDRASGTIETTGGELLLRLADRRDATLDFASIPVLADARGAVVRLGDIAEIREGFEDSTVVSAFEGQPSVQINVFSVGQETPLSVSEAARRALPDAMAPLPEAIGAVILDDDSESYRDRIQLLIGNGLIGLGLVLVILTLFLELRLAFWVAVGIPTAFLGTMLFLPLTDTSINMVSMFAFILALGIVVDDAIVAGENIFEYLQRGMSRIDAAIQGARDIAVPLSFSILTNIIAFIPLALVPGWMGKLWFAIPVVVSLAFLMSWIEGLFILPAHLASVARADPNRRPGPLKRLQLVFAGGLDWFIVRVYGPLLRLAIGWRYLTAALMVALLLIVAAIPLSGRMGWGLFPEVPRDNSRAIATMPIGAPLETTLAVRDRLAAAAREVIAANGGDSLAVGIQTLVDGTRVDVRAYLTAPELRPIETTAFTAAWREAVGPLPGARAVRFESSWGGPGSSSLSIELSHSDPQVLAAASADLAGRLAEFAPVHDTDDGFTAGKAELAFRLTERGQSLGLTSQEVAAQVRAAFWGAEALRQQQGRNEVTVRVRLPRSERRSEADIETFLIRSPDGGLVPLFEVAEIRRGRADASIRRIDGQRVVTVTANVEPPEETNQVMAAATAELLPQLVADHPGLAWSLGGRQATQKDTMDSFLTFSVPLALLLIYVALAVPFRSYLQPLVIMMAIPFGFVGAILGHLLMGYPLSIISVFGIIALSGVVINAGIVMIDYANKARAAGADAHEAIWRAGVRRFRPILLTTLTTFGGLAPMIFETSRQAQFMIPMAISLGYGIVFATVIVLFLIPALYLVVEDVRTLVGRARRFLGWLVFPPRPPGPPQGQQGGGRALAAE
jgi:multidrug efflux pump subunit AcrB